jgi:hypothetical protein
LVNATDDCSSAGCTGGLSAVAEDNGGATGSVDHVFGAEKVVVSRVDCLVDVEFVLWLWLITPTNSSAPTTVPAAIAARLLPTPAATAKPPVASCSTIADAITAQLAANAI